MFKVRFLSSLLTLIVSSPFTNGVQAQVSPKSVDTQNPLNWRSIPKSNKNEKQPIHWEVIPESLTEKDSPKRVIWKLLETHTDTATPGSEKPSSLEITPPSSLDDVEKILNSIPLKYSDYKPILNLSNAVPTASILDQDEWNLSINTISPFKFESGTGNQNYAIRIDTGLTEKLQVSGFYSEADDPLNASIEGLDIRPANLWKVFGASARWQFKKIETLSIAFNGSIESWTVGSGGSDSRAKNSGDQASPNIFNDSGRRVETQNIVGSLAIPVTWEANNKLQFTFAPGISFLPSNQGARQGGEGKFYGNNSYLSGGLLWQPNPQVGITGTVTQPIGSSTNNFERNRNFSKATVLSGGLNWHLNPRIALQGQLTNGFGATPATSILTLPSDNRIGYNASFIFTAGAPDTPQPPLTSTQKSLSLSGLTVNTGLVPPSDITLAKVSADNKGNFETLIGHSISNILHLEFYRSQNNNIPQSTVQARTYANDGAVNLRGSGKAVLTSPLRGAPIWSALRLSFGRNMDSTNNTADGYLFAETPLTWEANPKISFNFNPKVAWSGVGTLWGTGISANIQLAPRLELIPEANIILSGKKESNGTLGLRWNATDDIAIEAYGSTASSLTDIGQLLNAKKVRLGCRLIVKL